MATDHAPTNNTDHAPTNNTIGYPLMHLSALKQATGEAIYIDDLPYMEREMYASLILSERAHATFTLDTSRINDIEVCVRERETVMMCIAGRVSRHCR